MKIALLTMTFNNKYGGYLQAYSLMESLKKLGHEPELLFVQLQNNDFKSSIKKYLKKYVLGYLKPKWNYERYQNTIEKNTNYFSDTYILPKTKPIYNKNDFLQYEDKYNAYIIGSDQVWRPTMYKYIDEAFFGFVKNKNATLLSYAASFGLDTWEYTDEQTNRFKEQLKRFRAISVREDSGIHLCKRYFESEVEHVLDPTMLLSIEEYRNIIVKENEPKSKGELLTYILDETEEKIYLKELISKELDLKIFAVNVKSKDPEEKLEDRIYSTVTSWLRGFDDAKYIVTDSFHGCVFSILFNKPFIVYGNKRRGMSRFDSLLKMFDLEDRLVVTKEDITIDKIKKEIDWIEVNKKLKKYINDSIEYLKTNLKSEI